MHIIFIELTLSLLMKPNINSFYDDVRVIVRVNNQCIYP